MFHGVQGGHCVAADPPEHRVAADHAARCVRASDGSLPPSTH